jgi:hypothetical protein
MIQVNQTLTIMPAETISKVTCDRPLKQARALAGASDADAAGCCTNITLCTITPLPPTARLQWVI